MEESKSIDKIKEVVVYKLFQFYDFSDKKKFKIDSNTQHSKSKNEIKNKKIDEKLLYDTYQIFKNNLNKNPSYLCFNIKYCSKELFLSDNVNNKEIKWSNLKYQIKHKIYENLVNNFYFIFNNKK